MSTKDHNKGQEDASEGKYEPPHSVADEVITAFFGKAKELEDVKEENESYDKGWSHTKDQK